VLVTGDGDDRVLAGLATIASRLAAAPGTRPSTPARTPTAWW
jgi:hypothetical protein